MNGKIVKRSNLARNNQKEIIHAEFDGEVKTPAQRIIDFSKAMYADWMRYEDKVAKLPPVPWPIFIGYSLLLLVAGAVWGMQW